MVSNGGRSHYEELLALQSQSALRKSRLSDGGSISNVPIQRQTLIVDKDADLTEIVDRANSNFNGEMIKNSIREAIENVQVDGYATVKITSNLYEE